MVIHTSIFMSILISSLFSWKLKHIYIAWLYALISKEGVISSSTSF